MECKCILVLSLLYCSLFRIGNSLTVYNGYVGNDVKFSFEHSFWDDLIFNILGAGSFWNIFTRVESTATIENIENKYFLRRVGDSRGRNFKEYFSGKNDRIYVTLKNVIPSDDGIYWVTDVFRNIHLFELKTGGGDCNAPVLKCENGRDIYHKIVCYTSTAMQYVWSCDDDTTSGRLTGEKYMMVTTDFDEDNKRKYEVYISDAELVRRRKNGTQECKFVSVNGKYNSSSVTVRNFESIESCKLLDVNGVIYRISCEVPSGKFYWTWNGETIEFGGEYERFSVNRVDNYEVSLKPEGIYNRYVIALTAKNIDGSIQLFGMTTRIDGKYHTTNAVNVRM